MGGKWKRRDTVKKFLLGLFVGASLMITTSVFADEGLEKIVAYLRPSLPITLDGNPVKLESSPVMVDGSTYLKLRDIAALTGLEVTWNDKSQTVELSSRKEGGVSQVSENPPKRYPETEEEKIQARVDRISTDKIQEEIDKYEKKLELEEYLVRMATENGSQQDIARAQKNFNEIKMFLDKLKERQNELKASQ